MAERDPKSYFAALRQTFPLATGTDPAAFKKTLDMLAQTRKSQQALRALGTEEEEKVQPGIFQRLFDQDTGVLMAPARFGSALVLDVLGYEDENLKKYSPLESAIRSATGQFAITGGDIFRVNDGDSMGERLAKFASAFVFDVATDPITYFGPVSIFSKQGAAVSAVRNGERILSTAIRAGGEVGAKTDTLVDDLFRRSRLFQAADNQRRLGAAAAKVDPTKAGRLLEDAMDTQLGARTGDTPMDILGMTAEGLVADTTKAKIAGAELGRIVGEAFLTGGRVRVRKELTNLLGSEAAARRMFRELPQDIAGGLFFKTPTGRVVGRVAGGRGGPTGVLGETAEALASARFAISATGPGRIATKFFGGAQGEQWGAVKRGLLKGTPSVDRDTLLDYTTYKKAVQERRDVVTMLGIRHQAALSTVLAARQELPEAERPLFENWLKTYFSQPKTALDAGAGEAERAAQAAAQRLRDEMNYAAEELRAAGIDIGDLGDDFVPLVMTEEEAERLLLEGYRAVGSANNVFHYSPTKMREAYMLMMPDPEDRARAGFDIPNLENAVFLNAASINKILDRNAFETDPLLLLGHYLRYAGTALAARRFNEVAMATGTLLRFPAQSKKVYDAFAAIAFLQEATKKAAPTARRKAEVMRRKAEAQLRDAMSEATLRDAQRAMRTQQVETLRAYNASQSAVAGAREALQAADQELAAATEQYEVLLRQQTEANLTQYADTNMQQAVAEWQRIRNNASSRLSKARRKSEEAMADFNALANTPAGQDAARVARERMEKVDLESVSVEDARAQLAEAQAYRQQVLPVFVERQMQAQQAAFTRYEQAVARRTRAVEAFDVARTARNDAHSAYKATQKNTTVMRIQAVDSLTDAYVLAKTQFDSVAMRIGNQGLDQVSDALAAEYRVAKQAFKEARNMLFNTLGYSKKVKVRNAGVEYAETIVDLADKLSAEQLTAARIFANADAMDDIMRGLNGANEETMLNAIGDMMETYKGIRQYLGWEELVKLDAAERRLLSLDPTDGTAKFEYTADGNILDMRPEDLVKKSKPEVSAAGKAMYSKKGIRQIGASEAGANIIKPRTLEDVWAPDGVANILESFYRAREFPNEWEKYIAQIYDPLLLMWKGATTVGRGPAYVMLNTVGGLGNNFYARVSIKAHIQSAKMVSETVQAVRRVRKANPSMGYAETIPLVEAELRKTLGNINVNGVNVVDLFESFLRRGGHFTEDMMYQSMEMSRRGLEIEAPLQRLRGRTAMTQESLEGAPAPIQKLATYVLANPYQAFMSDMAQSSELFIRFAAYLDGWAKFKNLDDAFDLTTMLHFDYQDLAPAEIWFKRFIPFYTWARKNIPLQMRAAFTMSDQFSKLIKANNAFREAFEADDEWLNDYLPDYIVQTSGFVSAIKFGGNNLALFNKMPMTDLDKMFQVVDVAGIPMVLPRRGEVAQLLGPTIKTPLELLMQRNFQYGREYDSFSAALGAQTNSLLPQWLLVKRVLSSAGLPVEQERRVSNMFQLLIGAPYGMSTYTEQSLRGAAMGRNIELSKQVREAAAEAGVDVEWLRDQLSKGVSPEVLAMRVSYGAGNVERIAAQKRREGKDVTRGETDYRGLLDYLESQG